MEDSPTLELGFTIDTGGAIADILKFSQMFDDRTVQIIRQMADVEKATGGMMQFGAATARVNTFGVAATRELQSVSQAMAQTERAGEAMIGQFERQALTIGKTKDEIRDAKLELISLTAAQQGNTDLVERLAGASLLATEARARAEATVNAQLLERSRIEEALERNTGVGRPSAIQSGATFSALAERERELEVTERQAAAERGLIDAQRQQNNLLAERANLQAAIERSTGVGRAPATDNGATFSALAARAADDEARATTAAAVSAERLAREHAELVAIVRGSQAAMEADAAAAERMRMSTDPLYAATKRLNDEIAESTRLYQAGATAPAEYARQQQVLSGQLLGVSRGQDEATRATGALGGSTKLASHHAQNLAFQFQDLGVQMFAAAGSSAPLKMAFMALIQQGTQIQGIMSQAGIGIRGVAGAFVAMSKSVLLATVTNPILLGIAATIAVFAGTVALLNKSANEGESMKKYAASLGLTAKEIRNLDNVTVTWGDTAKAVFQVAGAAIWSSIGPAVTSVWDTMKEWLAWVGSAVKTAVNFSIAVWVGGYNAIKATWSQLPAAMGDLFFSAVNFSIEAINSLIRKSVEGINGFIATANGVLDKVGLHMPELNAPQIDKVNNQFAGAAAKVGKTIRDEITKAAQVDYVGSAGVAIVDQARKNARDRIKKQAEEKGYLDPEKPKTDKHAEQLAREAAAIEAQIAGLYKLADAYKVSGGEALIAEARVKAETDAIKKRGDIEEFVQRQVRLAIAQRVSDAAKATATMRDQAAAQEAVNAMVRAGLAPVEQAADLVRNRMADLPLLAALEAAQKTNDLIGIKKTTQALADQQAARAALTKSETDARYLAATATANNRVAELKEELRLIGATDEARARSMAELKARQEAKSFTGLDAASVEAYVRAQGDIAVQTITNEQAQAAYNASLTETADLWDIVAGKVQSAAQGMSEAFGPVGRAIGDVASIFASYQAQRTRAEAEHDAQVKKAGKNQILLAQETRRFALQSSGAQLSAYGDMLGAAKGFFNEGSKGYKALAAAEKVYRVAQFAMSLQAMIQNAAETLGFVANSTARSTAAAAEGIATQSKLPFPANIAAMAATAAALVAAGIAVFGGGGSGAGSSGAPVSNTGTGSVLGDPSAKSDSIKNSIDALKQVDLLTNSYSRQMAASLRSIDTQIGGVASLVARSGDINANAGVTEGFKMSGFGSLLSKIPLIGGILGGLFGSKTTVTGSGLYGGAQSVGSILDGGFDASYYSDIQKKKKLFGITTGTSYSTQFSGADANLENQFSLILRSFNDAIAAAAVPLGESTASIEARLRGFVVDIGRIDLQGLSGTEIQEKLSAVFGKAADGMASAAFPGLQQFQKVGEGLFETLVRVSSTVEAVTTALDQMAGVAPQLSVAAKLGIADQFDSIGDFTSAVGAYFEAFYTSEEQAAAKTAQLTKVLASLGLTMPSSLDAYRALVEAQDLNTAAGQATYATLLQLAPAFADLQTAMEGAKSAADIASERIDLQRQLLQLRGDTAAIRALDLAKVDPSNRALQQQIWDIQDAQEAAKSAQTLADAWKSVGDTIMTEIKRIRGLNDTASGGGFAQLQGQFNAASTAARGGDQDAAKLLPGISQALLTAAANAATSKQELDRIRAQTAASLEATYGAITALTKVSPSSTPSSTPDAAATAAGATSRDAANDDTAQAITALSDELAATRQDLTSALAQIAGNTGGIKKTLDTVTAESGGLAIATQAA